MSLETSGSSRLCTLHKCIITGMNKRIKRFKCKGWNFEYPNGCM